MFPECHLLKKSELPDLRRFMAQHWRQDHPYLRNPDFMDWQFDGKRLRFWPGEMPEDGCGSVLLARKEGGEVGGILGFIAQDMTLMGQTGRGIWITNLLNGSDGREGGYGLALLMRVLAAKFDFVGVLGMSEEIADIYKGLRFEFCGQLPGVVLIQDLQAVNRLARKGQFGPPDASASVVAENVGFAPWSSSLASQWDDVWNESFASGMIAASRTAEWLEDRYLRHPVFDYELRLLMQGDKPKGLLVLREETAGGQGIRLLRVLEFLVPEGLVGSAVSLLRAELASRNLAFADFYCSSQIILDQMLAAGFQPNDPLTGPFVPHQLQPPHYDPLALELAFWSPKAVRKERGVEAAAGNLYVTRGDSERDRPV